MTVDERWRSIPSWNGIYEASSLGRVRRSDSHAILHGHVRSYVRVKLSRRSRLPGSRRQLLYVHRLVAEAFFGACPLGMEVNHKNGRKTDNSLRNLEYVSRSENALHKFRVLGYECRHGERVPSHKLTDEIVCGMRARRVLGCSFASLGREYGVCTMTAWNACSGKTWRHVL